MPPVRRLPFSCLTIAGALALNSFCGCSARTKSVPAREAANTKPQTIRVGEVSVVDERKRFVLIDLQSNLYVPEPGVRLRTLRNATETAKLKVAPERKRPFIAADVIEGDPAMGDEVVQ